MKKIESEKKIETRDEIAELREKFNRMQSHYTRIHKRMRLLDATDKGDLWKALHAKFPPYQILPDTNFVSYVKDNILSSLYTVAKSAQIVPTNEEDIEACEFLNVALEHEWDTNNIPMYQYRAGERAALQNLGLTRVYWDTDKDKLGFSNIDPIKFMRDPFADCLDEAGYCVTWNSYHKSFFMNNKLYKTEFKNAKKAGKLSTSTESVPDYSDKHVASESDNHYILYIWNIRRKDGRMDEIHTVNNEVVLFKKENIKPAIFPYAELYCNLPGSSVIGISPAAKIFANNMVYNLMDSVALTSEYKNQRPPKFISNQSGLNIKAFAKHGNEADRTFVVNGDAQRAVHYHQYPQISAQLPNMMARLSENIQQVSGVDGRYTGRDTGSIITTGGTEEMLNRVTMIDTFKVVNYENYTRRLTELVLKMMLEFAPKRTYMVKDDKKSTPEKTAYKAIEIDFPTFPADTVYNYAIQISSELPKNKQRVQAWANNMMEKQMQYQQQGLQIDVITPEEWIRCQDVPYREQMLKRMGLQSQLNSYMEAETAVTEYATMLDQGILPEDAMALAAQGIDNMKQGMPTPSQEAGVSIEAGDMPIE